MVSDYFSVHLPDLCRSAGKNLQEVRDLLRELTYLSLTEKEEQCLVAFYPPDPKHMADTLDEYEGQIAWMRGEPEGARPWLSEETMNKVVVNDKVLVTDEFAMRFVRSVYLWQTDDYHVPALQLLNKFETYTGGTFLFESLPPQWKNLYRNGVLMIMNEYISYLPHEYLAFYLGSASFHTAISSGLDVDDALKRAVGYFTDDAFRMDYSATAAGLIYTNPTKIGKNSHDEPMTMEKWADMFGDFSQKKFDPKSFIAFSEDKIRWHGCTEAEQMLILYVLMLYSRLINGWYVVANYNLNTINWQKFFTKETLTDVDIANLIEWFHIQPDIITVKKSLRSQLCNLSFENEPFASNILSLSAAMEEEFATEPLVYFDETAGGFHWFV